MIKNLNKMIKSNKASITVEASFSLVVFIFAFLSILFICRLVKAQTVIQYSINQTAREMSQYSYIVSKLGLIPKKEDEEYFIAKTDEIIDEMSNFTKFVNSMKSQSFSLDSQDYLKSMLSVVKNGAVDIAASRLVAEPMSKMLFKKYLPTGSKNADEYLKDLGVDKGLQGVYFGASTLFEDGHTINVTAIYSMKLKMPLFPERVFSYKLNASTAGWLSNKVIENDSYEENENIWEKPWQTRTSYFIKQIANEQKNKKVRIPVKLDLYDQETNTFSYIHSINTEEKSYNKDGELNISAIKSLIKKYSKEAVENSKKTEEVVLENGTKVMVAQTAKPKKQNMIIVLNDNAFKSAAELNRMKAELEKELGVSIEYTYRDGIIKNEGE